MALPVTVIRESEAEQTSRHIMTIGADAMDAIVAFRAKLVSGDYSGNTLSNLRYRCNVNATQIANVKGREGALADVGRRTSRDEQTAASEVSAIEAALQAIVTGVEDAYPTDARGRRVQDTFGSDDLTLTAAEKTAISTALMPLLDGYLAAVK